MKNIAMRIRYDGTNYHGWQRQKNGITIQQVIEDALSGLIGEDIRVTGCSRTDSGVHALEYVFNFYSNTSIPVQKLPYALNCRLAGDIVAYDAFETDLEFNSRFSSCGKRYIYRIWNSKVPDPFQYRYSWHVPYRIDVSSMICAASKFEGYHDFAGFMASGGSQKTTFRNIRMCDVSVDELQPELIVITVEADAFLYNMVRIITGTLLEVGFGRIFEDDISKIILAKDRKLSGLTAPPQGLFLKKVYYDLG